MKWTSKMGVYGLAVATLLGTTLAETSMAGKRGKKRPVKSARSGKDVAGHLQIESSGTRKGPFLNDGIRNGPIGISASNIEEDDGIRKDPKRTTGKRGKKRPKKSVLGFPFSLRRKAR